MSPRVRRAIHSSVRLLSKPAPPRRSLLRLGPRGSGETRPPPRPPQQGELTSHRLSGRSGKKIISLPESQASVMEDGVRLCCVFQAVGMPPLSHAYDYLGNAMKVGLTHSLTHSHHRLAPLSPAGPLKPPSVLPLPQTPVGGHKRVFSRLIPSPEPSPEGAYVGQHSQGLGGHYADSYLKRKRIF